MSEPLDNEPDPFATSLEIESQKEQSLAHEKEITVQAGEIMTPEPVPIVMAPPEPVQATGNGGASPVLPVDRPPPIAVKPLHCVECGKGPFDDDRALSAHVRFKHTLPKARKAAQERKEGRAPVENGQAIPAPDFSDIGGQAAPPPIAPLVDPGKRLEQMAAMTFDMSTSLLARVFGPEWLPSPDPDNKDISTERATMVLAIQKYYQSVDLPDIPPGYMLCFVCLAYAAPRLNAQPTKTKLQGAWLWFKSKFSRKKSLGVLRVMENKP